MRTCMTLESPLCASKFTKILQIFDFKNFKLVFKTLFLQIKIRLDYFNNQKSVKFG